MTLKERETIEIEMRLAWQQYDNLRWPAGEIQPMANAIARNHAFDRYCRHRDLLMAHSKADCQRADDLMDARAKMRTLGFGTQ